jgi:hypothetical protein
MDMGETLRNNTEQPQGVPAPQVVSDESQLALRILTGLRRLACHARDTAGVAGSVVVQVHLAPSPGREVEIGQTRFHGIPQSRSHASASSGIAVAETAASLDDLADPGPELVAAAARLLDELGTSFGIAEMCQLTQDGAIRQRYWTDARPLLNWAQHFGVRIEQDTAIRRPSFGVPETTATGSPLTRGGGEPEARAWASTNSAKRPGEQAAVGALGGPAATLDRAPGSTDPTKPRGQRLTRGSRLRIRTACQIHPQARSRVVRLRPPSSALVHGRPLATAN